MLSKIGAIGSYWPSLLRASQHLFTASSRARGRSAWWKRFGRSWPPGVGWPRGNRRPRGRPDLYSNLTASLDLLYGEVVRFAVVEDLHMDLLMILGTIVFFVVAIAYTA